jgi:hypothetical protein
LGLGFDLRTNDLTIAKNPTGGDASNVLRPSFSVLESRPMGIRMLVTITIPEMEERTVALVQDLVALLRKYPGVQMKTVTRPRLRFGEGKRSAGKKKGPGHRSRVSVA